MPFEEVPLTFVRLKSEKRAVAADGKDEDDQCDDEPAAALGAI